MKITISSLHFKSDIKLENFVREKVTKVSNLFDGVIGSDVTLKLDQSSTNENKIAEIRIQIPGNDLFAKKQAKSFEEAVDNAVDALRKQITRHKQKVKGL
ncbi:MAG: ribosome-associated translation inhibitor RaiA [Bacteroidetes bacterium]|nr:MAG: ribosome-associated translation inhibitor RaiA [Bacteroidota bacterium]